MLFQVPRFNVQRSEVKFRSMYCSGQRARNLAETEPAGNRLWKEMLNLGIFLYRTHANAKRGKFV